MTNSPRGWHSRGYLPHYDGGQIAQTINIHLADALPKKVLAKWKRELDGLITEEHEIELRKRIEAYLDKGHGNAFLKRHTIASMVENSLLFFDKERYNLSAWVVMPNHVHLLLTPMEGYELSAIVHSIKSYTANEANKLLHRTGRFWQEDYFDRRIRNGKHFVAAINYIHMNPVKAGLCKRPEDWPFSSASWTRRHGTEAKSETGSAGILPAVRAKREQPRR